MEVQTNESRNFGINRGNSNNFYYCLCFVKVVYMNTEIIKWISIIVSCAGLIYVIGYFIQRQLHNPVKEVKQEIKNKSNELNKDFNKLVEYSFKGSDDPNYYYSLRKELRKVASKKEELDYAIDNFLKRRQEKNEKEE